MKGVLYAFSLGQVSGLQPWAISDGNSVRYWATALPFYLGCHFKKHIFHPHVAVPSGQR